MYWSFLCSWSLHSSWAIALCVLLLCAYVATENNTLIENTLKVYGLISRWIEEFTVLTKFTDTYFPQHSMRMLYNDKCNYSSLIARFITEKYGWKFILRPTV